MVDPLAELFPALRTSAYQITSPPDKDYNCIAHAAGDVKQWWWPDSDLSNDAVYWPVGIVREETVTAFIAAFATISYTPCDTETLEPGCEKIALFADAQGIPTHAARQLPGGRWTSKLGRP
jgi:hypothetical protein